MRIEKLTLTNYRCFEHREIEFAPGFNVLIGDNMSGKTSVLDALIVLLAKLVRTPREERPRLALRDVRRGPTVGEAVPTAERPTRVVANIKLDGEAIELEQSLLLREVAYDPVPLETRLSEAALAVVVGDNARLGQAPLPMALSYAADRPWGRTEPGPLQLPEAGGFAMAYENWWQPAVDLEGVRSFCAQMVGEMRESHEDAPAWQGIATTIGLCLPGMPTVSYHFRARDLVAIIGDQAVPLYTLSDGYRRVLAMAADIARRCFILNPHLGAEAARKTPGVVLIDEIDLHLHPKWQRTIVDSLKRAFPLIQFIATTHSPFIIQSLRPGELIRLDGPVGDYADESIEDIAGQVQDVPGGGLSDRLAKLYAAAQLYEAELAKGPSADPRVVAGLKDELMLATARASNDPAMVALRAELESQRLVAGVGDAA